METGPAESVEVSVSIAEIAERAGVSLEVIKAVVEHLRQVSRREPLDLSELLTYGDLARRAAHLLQKAQAEYRTLDLSERVPPEFPSHVQIQTIGGCNASCVMCAMSSPVIRQTQKGRMSRELFLKIIAECAGREECEGISLYLQNEPLLDSELAWKIRAVKDRSAGRLGTRIVTNGYLLTEDRSAELVDAGIDVISISLNAFTRATYAQVMGGLDLDRTLRNIESLLHMAPPGLQLILTFMVTSVNEHEIREAIDYWSERGVFCGAYAIGTMSGTVPFFESVRAKSTPIGEERECYVPLHAAAILCTGELLLCCTDWARRSVLGNLATQSLFDLWHSKPLADLRRDAIFDRFDHEICRKCLGQSHLPGNLVYEGGPGSKHRGAARPPHPPELGAV